MLSTDQIGHLCSVTVQLAPIHYNELLINWSTNNFHEARSTGLSPDGTCCQ